MDSAKNALPIRECPVSEAEQSPRPCVRLDDCAAPLTLWVEQFVGRGCRGSPGAVTADRSLWTDQISEKTRVPHAPALKCCVDSCGRWGGIHVGMAKLAGHDLVELLFPYRPTYSIFYALIEAPGF